MALALLRLLSPFVTQTYLLHTYYTLTSLLFAFLCKERIVGFQKRLLNQTCIAAPAYVEIQRTEGSFGRITSLIKRLSSAFDSQ